MTMENAIKMQVELFRTYFDIHTSIYIAFIREYWIFISTCRCVGCIPSYTQHIMCIFEISAEHLVGKFNTIMFQQRVMVSLDFLGKNGFGFTVRSSQSHWVHSQLNMGNSWWTQCRHSYRNAILEGPLCSFTHTHTHTSSGCLFI